MLTELTDEQKALIPDHVKKWIEIGVSTERTNRKEAEKAITAQYKHTGLQQPDFEWCPCPMSAGIAANLLINDAYGIFNKSYSVEQFCDELLNTPDKDNPDKIPDYDEKTIKNIADAIKRVGFKTEHLTQEQLDKPAPKKKVSQNKSNFIYPFGGTLCFSTAAYLDYLTTVCKINHTEWDQKIAEQKYCNYWYALDSLVLLCDRPTIIKRDEAGRMHSDDGPAYSYESGWGLWFNHGVKIDRQTVEYPKTLTIKQLNNNDNAEIKRIRIEKFGWENFLNLVEAEVLDERDNDIENTHEALMKYSVHTVLVCRCPSTARVYALEVAEGTKTCEDAQKWLRNNENGDGMTIIGAS